jgi:hypothetical protein
MIVGEQPWLVIDTEVHETEYFDEFWGARKRLPFSTMSMTFRIIFYTSYAATRYWHLVAKHITRALIQLRLHCFHVSPVRLRPHTGLLWSTFYQIVLIIHVAK